MPWCHTLLVLVCMPIWHHNGQVNCTVILSSQLNDVMDIQGLTVKLSVSFRTRDAKLACTWHIIADNQHPLRHTDRDYQLTTHRVTSLRQMQFQILLAHYWSCNSEIRRHFPTSGSIVFSEVGACSFLVRTYELLHENFLSPRLLNSSSTRALAIHFPASWFM